MKAQAWLGVAVLFQFLAVALWPNRRHKRVFILLVVAELSSALCLWLGVSLGEWGWTAWPKQ